MKKDDVERAFKMKDFRELAKIVEKTQEKLFRAKARLRLALPNEKSPWAHDATRHITFVTAAAKEIRSRVKALVPVSNISLVLDGNDKVRMEVKKEAGSVDCLHVVFRHDPDLIWPAYDTRFYQDGVPPFSRFYADDIVNQIVDFLVSLSILDEKNV